MKNPASIKNILVFSILLMGFLFSSVAFAMQPQIILFCSSWNMKCREARNKCALTANNLGAKFTEFDVDAPQASQKAMSIGLNMPSYIPYIYMIDSRGKIVKEQLYNGESFDILNQEASQALQIYSGK